MWNSFIAGKVRPDPVPWCAIKTHDNDEQQFYFYVGRTGHTLYNSYDVFNQTLFISSGGGKYRCISIALQECALRMRYNDTRCSLRRRQCFAAAQEPRGVHDIVRYEVRRREHPLSTPRLCRVDNSAAFTPRELVERVRAEGWSCQSRDAARVALQPPLLP